MQRGPTDIAKALNRSVVSQAKERAYCQNEEDAPEAFYRKHLAVQKLKK